MGFLYGASEANELEPLVAISDWLLSGPDIAWMKELRTAGSFRFVQQYVL